jgi:putative transposase
LSKKVKFVLNQLSHYQFRQHLLHKCKEYGCELKIVTEEYTSKCCGRCGFLSNNYSKRLKKCSNCNLEIDRDINGSRNILIKNWSGNYK